MLGFIFVYTIYTGIFSVIVGVCCSVAMLIHWDYNVLGIPVGLVVGFAVSVVISSLLSLPIGLAVDHYVIQRRHRVHRT